MGVGVGGGLPAGMPLGYPSSNGLTSSGLGGIPQRPTGLGAMPPSTNYGGIPPSARSPVASVPGQGLPIGMQHIQSMNGMPPPSASPHGALGPSGPSAPGITAAQLQAYPHLAGAAGFSTSQASIYGGPGLGSSPYNTPQPMTASYPSSSLGQSMHLNGGLMQSPYSGLGNTSTMPSPSMAPYPGGLTSYPSAMPSMVSPSAYGISSLRGPTAATPGGYPGMAQGVYPGQPPSNPGLLRTTPIVPTPAYPSNPYGRPL